MTKLAPVAKAEMLIRKPVTEVFEAFINPDITTKFWFTNSSGSLEVGKNVKWEWRMYGFSTDVLVKAIEENKRILVEWSTYGIPTEIEWSFKSIPNDTTFVSITNKGFSGDDETVVSQAITSTEGFAFVLAGLKAHLEHNVSLNLVRDRLPAIE